MKISNNKIMLAFLFASCWLFSAAAMHDFNDRFNPLTQLDPKIKRSLTIYQNKETRKNLIILEKAFLENNILSIGLLLQKNPILWNLYLDDFNTVEQWAYQTKNIRIIALIEACKNNKPIILDKDTYYSNLYREKLERIVDCL